MRVYDLDHIVLTTPDVEGSLAFYMGLLGLEGVRVDEWRAGEVIFPSVRINAATIIDLLQAPPGWEAKRAARNLDHLCLVVDRADVEAVAADPQFDVITQPVERYGARGNGWSVYVNDPDGNIVELRSYDG